MTTNKKLLIAIACLSVVLIALVATIAVVLVASPQYASSGVNMSYTATDVNLIVSAQYCLEEDPSKGVPLVTQSNETTLYITPDSRSGSFLQPTGQIEIGEYGLVYIFTLTCLDNSIDAKITAKLSTSDAITVEMFYWKDTPLTWLGAINSTNRFQSGETLSNLINAINPVVTIYVRVSVNTAIASDSEFVQGLLHWEFSRNQAY